MVGETGNLGAIPRICSTLRTERPNSDFKQVNIINIKGYQMEESEFSTNSDSRDKNVVDVYKYWTKDAIKANLDSKRLNYSILCYNLGYDMNVATVIRCSNAFLASQVYIYPRRKFDKRGTVGTHCYENLKHVKQLDDITDIPADAIWVGMDNVPTARPVETFTFPTDKHIVLCFGQESTGLPQEILAKCHHLLYIQQYGSVRSLNVGVAAGIAIYELVKAITKV